MSESICRAEAIDDHVLKLEMCNGSIALVNMRLRMQGMRFGALKDPSVFTTARVEEDFVVWRTPMGELRASARELLDIMLNLG